MGVKEMDVEKVGEEVIGNSGQGSGQSSPIVDNEDRQLESSKAPVGCVTRVTPLMAAQNNVIEVGPSKKTDDGESAGSNDVSEDVEMQGQTGMATWQAYIIVSRNDIVPKSPKPSHFRWLRLYKVEKSKKSRLW
jgi:hypothetical protein